MNKREVCIIFNPAAKGERARKSIPVIRDAFRDAEFIETERAGHATDLAVEAGKRFRKVLAAGGDGTINEVANGLAHTDAALGILPIGTVNVFAMELGISTRLEKAIQVIKRGKVRQVDLAKANDRFFVQLAGVGLDAETVRMTNNESKKALGPLSYLMTLTQVVGQVASPLKICNGHEEPLEGTFVLIGNGRHYGGPFNFFPEAQLDDGLLDICVFHRLSHFDLLRYFRGILVNGGHTKFTDVTYFKTDHIEISGGLHEAPFEVDGEFHGNCPVKFSVAPRALKVLVPDKNNK
ncbi:MAG: diacylglycerol kinase family protein [Verrucomicrobiota bacterium]